MDETIKLDKLDQRIIVALQGNGRLSFEELRGRHGDHYTRFVMDTLLKHPSVQDCKTSFVMRPVKSNTSLVV